MVMGRFVVVEGQIHLLQLGFHGACVLIGQPTTELSYLTRYVTALLIEATNLPRSGGPHDENELIGGFIRQLSSYLFCDMFCGCSDKLL